MIISKLFEIRQERISLKAINSFLSYKIKENDVDDIFKITVAESIAKFVSDGKISFVENYKNVWNLEDKKEEKNESAEDIVAKVLKKHGIKIKGEVENGS